MAVLVMMVLGEETGALRGEESNEVLLQSDWG